MEDKEKLLEESLKIQAEKLINFPELTDSSLIVLRTNKPTPETYKLIEYIQKNYGGWLIKKNCNFLLLKKETSIDCLNEKTMNSYGWFKKGKIITLN